MMATTAPRFRPNYLRSPDLFEICAHYSSAEAAFEAGNYYVALLKAEESGDHETAALARLMCGDFVGGMAALDDLDAPSPETAPFRALAQWVGGNNKAAAACLTGGDFDYLESVLGKGILRLLVVCGTHTEMTVPDPAPDGLTLHTVCTQRDEHAPPLAAVLPDDAEIDAVIVLDVYGPRLPDGVFDLHAPVILLTYDTDFQLHHQFDDLSRVDLIVVNSATEHSLLDRIFPAPVTAFPAFVSPFMSREFSSAPSAKNLDILHTGLSFTPIMREKAQYLFRLAVLDDPDINIQIHQGFLKKDAYLEKVRQTKFWPVCNARCMGGLTDRVADGLSFGARPLVPENDFVSALLTKADQAVKTLPEETLEADILQALSTWDDNWPGITEVWPGITSEIQAYIGQMPDRAVAFFKFCVFEALRRRSGIENRQAPTASDTSAHSRDCARLFEALSRIIERPSDQTLIAAAQSIYDEASARRPNSLTLPFNMGRILWALGEREQAATLLQQAIDNSATGLFDPRHENVWLLLFKGTNEMMPYEDYFMANARDLSAGRKETLAGRAIIAATAKTYLALNALQDGDLTGGAGFLEAALTDFPDHWPAAKLRCKTLYAVAESGGGDWGAVSAALDSAVNLYPPVISELVPFGISAELARDNEDGAVELAKTWAYFATRVTWEKDDDHPIPDATWKCVRALFDRLPDQLQTALRERYPDQL